MKSLKLLLLGFGNAGKAYAKLLLEKQKQIAEEFGYDIQVVGIVTATKGNLINKEGIDLYKVLKQIEAENCFCEDLGVVTNLGGRNLINELDYDVLLEMTPLNIFTGQPAIDHIKLALSREKHVITANKGPIAFVFSELQEMAKKNNALFMYETTVMDGTPIFNLVDETLSMCKVLEISGILNSTTNFLLDEMTNGKTFDEALTEGRKRGFVEADVSLDIEGYDAAAKITALANVLMDANLTPKDIRRNGIEKVTKDMLTEAKSRKKVLKLVCRAFYENGKVIGEVKLKELAMDDALSTIKGTSSIISITTDLMGTISITEHNPEIEQTGYGIFSDTIRIIKNIK